MSRIGRKPIVVPQGVKIDKKDDKVVVTGNKGTLECPLFDGISLEIKDGQVKIDRNDDSSQKKAFHGLVRALVNNMIIGVTEGYTRTLQVIGTGYAAEVIGPWIKLSVGFSHDIMLEIPENLQVEAQTVPRREQGPLGVQAVVTVSGINKEEVGKFAAEIRHCRPPAPNFKGKGIRWKDERVRIVSKAGAA
ncbi:MAG: 50S ribosomal protein L6 [Candidatus Cloacimonetes bacterium]|nr:50S ribosomal protein L6 [Candidatus Cloacimonadota bacterium]